MRPMLLLAGSVLVAAAAGSYSQDAAAWRARYEAGLKAPDGWLSVAGLFWLREGANVVGSDGRADVVLPHGAPGRAGVLRLARGKVAYQAAGSSSWRELKPDTSDHPDVVTVGDLSMTMIVRGGKTGVRLRDPHAETLQSFTGCKWFPASETWRVKAKWVAYRQPRNIAITNILGMTDEEPSPGYAEFAVRGRTLRLEPVLEDGTLFFMFKDQTSGKATYGAGRFLYADLPKGSEITLDFNQAHNPPCAFTAFATCPLPPKQNSLPAPVEAGERNYGRHP